MNINKYNELKDNKIPIMFLTTLYNDPSKDLEELLAVKELGKENDIEIPLGDNEYIINVIIYKLILILILISSFIKNL